ncbi:MAG: hypothetical protein R3F49_10605 [Planctomycetota bacterium]
MTAPTVASYIESAPKEHQAALRSLRRRLKDHLGACTKESIGASGFPVLTVDDVWVAGFAWRKKGPMLYVMNTGLLDRFAERLGKLRTGRSCIEWHETKGLSFRELGAVANEILAIEAKRLSS